MYIGWDTKNGEIISQNKIALIDLLKKIFTYAHPPVVWYSPLSITIILKNLNIYIKIFYSHKGKNINLCLSQRNINMAMCATNIILSFILLWERLSTIHASTDVQFLRNYTPKN